jgi:hypothetical protein
LDEAWLWETEKNGNSEAEAAKYIKENIDDITLQSWVFNRQALSFSDGNSYI